MNQIGIIGKPSRRRFQVVNKLEGNSSLAVRIFQNFDEVRSYLNSSRLDGLVFVEDTFKDPLIEMMDMVSHSYPELVILCLVSRVESSQREELRRFNIPRCTVLDFNHELKDLKGVVQRMVNGEKVAIRAHYRYAVSKRAQLITKTGPVKKIHIVDISAGGLQAKSLGWVAHQGEKVQIQVPKDNGKGSHMIVGRVAWLNKRGHFGIKFDQVTSQSNPNSFSASA